MRDLLHRLVQTKMILTSLVLILFGVAAITISEQTSATAPGLMGLFPWGEVGGILIGSGLLSIWIDHLFRTEHQATSDLRLRELLHEHAPVMRDAVLEAFAANNEDLARVATPATLDRIVNNSLALRLEDQQFADEIFADIATQAIGATERWYDATLDITLTPLPKTRGQPAYFAVTVRWEYTTIPKHKQRRFVCVSDRQEYAELSGTNSDTSAWYLKDRGHYNAKNRNAFELLQFTINGTNQTIRRSSKTNQQAYTANIGTDTIDAGIPATFSYTYRTVTPQNGHLLFFDIEQPTRDINITLDHTTANLANISAIDLIPSVRPTRIEHTPPKAEPKTIRIEIDGWTFPRSGIALVWTLASESHGQRPAKSDQGSVAEGVQSQHG